MLGLAPVYIGMAGIIAGAIGLIRVMLRAGFEHHGQTAAMLMSEEQRQKQRDQIFVALLDAKHPIDRWLVFVGFASCAVAAASIAIIAGS